jgi:hypothetical protein
MSTREKKEPLRAHSFSNVASRWDSAIQRELRQFAQYLWSDARLLGLVPIHSYRLRKWLESGIMVWWVERDIPPFDQYQCESYRVELSLSRPDQPQLVVRTGISAYPVVPMSIEGLKVALERAGADTPIIIHRQFGPALDP